MEKQIIKKKLFKVNEQWDLNEKVYIRIKIPSLEKKFPDREYVLVDYITVLSGSEGFTKNMLKSLSSHFEQKVTNRYVSDSIYSLQNTWKIHTENKFNISEVNKTKLSYKKDKSNWRLLGKEEFKLLKLNGDYYILIFPTIANIYGHSWEDVEKLSGYVLLYDCQKEEMLPFKNKKEYAEFINQFDETVYFNIY